MIHIYKNLISNYINHNLTVDDILTYAAKKQILLSKSDSIIIYNFIKRNYKNILNGDESSFQELQESISNYLYQKIMSLYKEYKSKFLI
ncbi:MAG: DUF2624 family protein [Bacilli bacterium]|nr:DUF2624 family protein [Bacilli bacterium]